MFILSLVTKWQDGRDSSKRVHKRDTWDNVGRWFLLNPNRFVDIKDRSTIAIGRSSLKFSDVDRDRRENLSYMELNSSPAEIIAQHDVPFHSKFITLGFYPKNNPHKTTVDTTVLVDWIAYFDDYNDPDHPDCVWMVYERAGFRRVEQLVEGTLEEIEDRLETGTTSTTTTTSDREQ
jgi:hypothetical protein